MSRNWSWKKIGLQKSWNQARKNLVPKNSWNWYKNLGIGLVQISGSLYTLTVSGGDCYLPSLMVWCWWSLFGCVKLSVWWISSSSCSKMMITSIYSDEDIECETFSSKYGDATLSKKISAPSLQRFVKENICLEAGKANPSFSANFWIPNICRFSVHLKHFWRPTNVCKIILWVIYCPPNPLCTEWLFLNPQIKQCCGTHFTLQRILPGFSKASLGLTFTIGFNPSDPFSTNPILQMLQYLLCVGNKICCFWEMDSGFPNGFPACAVICNSCHRAIVQSGSCQVLEERSNNRILFIQPLTTILLDRTEHKMQVQLPLTIDLT